jgi:hypothetical protein
MEEGKSTGFYRPDAAQSTDQVDSQTQPQDTSTEGPLASWSASEYIAHQKAASWYFGLLGIAVVVAAIVYIVTRDIISSIVVLVVAVLFGVFATRKPQVLEYAIHDSGLQIGNKFYTFQDFKSFSLIDDGAISSIFLMPTKRFMPGLTIYFPPEQEKQVTEAIGAYLPFEERDLDPVEKLMKKVRF